MGRGNVLLCYLLCHASTPTRECLHEARCCGAVHTGMRVYQYTSMPACQYAGMVLWFYTLPALLHEQKAKSFLQERLNGCFLLGSQQLELLRQLGAEVPGDEALAFA